MNSVDVGVPKHLQQVETEIVVVSTGSQVAVMPAVVVSVPMKVALEAEAEAVSDPRMAESDFALVSKNSLFVEDAVEKLVLVPTVAVVGTGMALVPSDLWDAALMWAGVVFESVETTVLGLDFVVGSMCLQVAVLAVVVWLERPKKVVAVAEGAMSKIALAETPEIAVVGPKMAVHDLDFVARHLEKVVLTHVAGTKGVVVLTDLDLEPKNLFETVAAVVAGVWFGVEFESVVPKRAEIVLQQVLAIEHLKDVETASSTVSVHETGFEIGLAVGPHLDPRHLLEAVGDLGLDPMTSQMDLMAQEEVRHAGIVSHSKPLFAGLVPLEILVASMHYQKQVVPCHVNPPGTPQPV